MLSSSSLCTVPGSKYTVSRPARLYTFSSGSLCDLCFTHIYALVYLCFLLFFFFSSLLKVMIDDVYEDIEDSTVQWLVGKQTRRITMQQDSM